MESKQQPTPKANLVFLNLFTLALGLGGIQVGFCFSGNNQTANVMAAKFGWDEAQTRFYNSLINAFSVAGMAAGSFLGG